MVTEEWRLDRKLKESVIQGVEVAAIAVDVHGPWVGSSRVMGGSRGEDSSSNSKSLRKSTAQPLDRAAPAA